MHACVLPACPEGPLAQLSAGRPLRARASPPYRVVQPPWPVCIGLSGGQDGGPLPAAAAVLNVPAAGLSAAAWLEA